jgi:hypothetical protein
MDWMTFPWPDDIKAHVTVLTEPVDCIVLGRDPAEGVHPALAHSPRARTIIDPVYYEKRNNLRQAAGPRPACDPRQFARP